MDQKHATEMRAPSRAIFGNVHVLPVAVAILESGGEDIRSAPLGRALHGCIPPKDVLAALDRLVAIGGLEELPYPGPPHPRVFVKRESCFWSFVFDYVGERGHNIFAG